MKRLTIAGLALFAFAASAHAADTPQETLAAKVVQLSGIERSLAALPETLKLQSDISALTQLPDEKPSAGDAAISAFDPEAAKKRLIKHIAENCDGDSLAKTVTWLESPLGLKITAAEEAEKGLDLQAGKLKFLAELKGNPPAQERIVLIRKLVHASGQMEMVEKVYEATAVRMATAMAGGSPEVVALAREKIKETWGPLEKQFMQQLVASDLYVYRSLPDSDLATYVTFLESDAGKRFSRAVVDGYGQIIEDLIIESQKELIEELKKQAQAMDDDEACSPDGDGATAVQSATK